MSVIKFPNPSGPWQVVAQRIETGTQVLFLAAPVDSLVLSVTADPAHAWHVGSLSEARMQARRFEDALGGFWIAQPVAAEGQMGRSEEI